MKAGDRVIVWVPPENQWDSGDREGKVIVVAPPYCIVVVEDDFGYYTTRYTTKIDQVKYVNKKGPDGRLLH